LHLAARANQTDIVRVLLRNGATVDAKARELQTPLHIASRLGNTDICMLLIQGTFKGKRVLIYSHVCLQPKPM
jgi:ankyrin